MILIFLNSLKREELMIQILWVIDTFLTFFRVSLNFLWSVFKIKEYGYRSDGLKYWAAIKKYVCGIVDIFYANDKERIF